MNAPLLTLLVWLDGMFAIMVPASLAPLILTLLWAERKAQRLGLVDVPPTTPTTAGPSTTIIPVLTSTKPQPLNVRLRALWTRFWHFSDQLDLVG